MGVVVAMMSWCREGYAKCWKKDEREWREAQLLTCIHNLLRAY